MDGNTSAIQLSGRFGNANGAELRVGDLKVGAGVFLMDTNVPHEVLVCKSGVMYSIVTYVKKDAMCLANPFVLARLCEWGFPLKYHCLILLFCINAIRLLCYFQNQLF